MRLDTLKMIAHEFEPIAHVTRTVSTVAESDEIEMRLSYKKDGKFYTVAMRAFPDSKQENVRLEVEMCHELMRDAITEGKPCA